MPPPNLKVAPRSLMNTLYLHCSDRTFIELTLYQHCQIVPSLYQHCAHIVQSLSNRTFIVPTLRPNCTNIVPTLHPHCTYSAPTLYQRTCSEPMCVCCSSRADVSSLHCSAVRRKSSLRDEI